MLKNRVGNETWLVHQPDHARVSGYLAAHWGNDHFALPGYFAEATHPELLREKVVHGIAEHDNGWWEWEAFPDFDPADSFPLNLPDVAREKPDAGLQRWRKGVPRLSEQTPYAALLVSQHAFWLYAFAFDDLPDLDDALRHPIFGGVGTSSRLVANAELTRAFLSEQLETRRALVERLRSDPSNDGATEPGHLLPHVRLLQIMDALSLLISFGGQRELSLADVPRQSWDDRVSMMWRPVANRRIVCDPFPFDTDPLEVFLPVRILSALPVRDQPPLIRLHSTALTTVRFEVASG